MADTFEKIGCGGCLLLGAIGTHGIYSEMTAPHPPVQLQNGYKANGSLWRDASYPGHLKVRLNGNIEEALARTRVVGRITAIAQVDDGKRIRDLTQIAVAGSPVLGSGDAINNYEQRDEIIIRMRPLDPRAREYVLDVRTDIPEGDAPQGFTPLALLKTYKAGDLISVAGLRDACCDSNDYLILKPHDVYAPSEIQSAK